MTTKRDQILQTAMRLFVDKGIQATPTSRIAKEAGVATGTLFHHFSSKEDLIHALYHDIYMRIIDYQKKHLDNALPPEERLYQVWKLDIEWGTQNVEYSHFLERYSLFYYASETAINELFVHFEHCIAMFKALINTKQLISSDIEYIIDHYIWNIRMNIIHFINHPEKCTPEAIKETFQIYWKGISNV